MLEVSQDLPAEDLMQAEEAPLKGFQQTLA
jgi:hypothetical protein